MIWSVAGVAAGRAELLCAGYKGVMGERRACYAAPRHRALTCWICYGLWPAVGQRLRAAHHVSRHPLAAMTIKSGVEALERQSLTLFRWKLANDVHWID